MDDVRRWSPPGWTGQPVLDQVGCSATAIDEALLSINSWLRGFGCTDDSMVDLHTPSGQACALSLICSLISSQLALGQDRTSLRDQQDKDRRSFEAAQRSIKGLEEAVAHSQTRIGTLETQLCKARDTAKEQVRDLQEKLKERDKRLIENRNRMESLSRQLRAAGITAAAGPTRTRGCGGDTSPSGHVRNKIETLETENRILRGQLQELNGRPAGSVKLGFGSSSISSAAGGAASRYGLGKAQRVPASEQGTVAGVGVDPGLSLLEMRDVEEQPLGQVEQRQLQGVARDLRASLCGLEDAQHRMAGQLHSAEQRAGEAEKRAMLLKAECDAASVRVQHLDRLLSRNIAAAHDAVDAQAVQQAAWQTHESQLQTELHTAQRALEAERIRSQRLKSQADSQLLTINALGMAARAQADSTTSQLQAHLVALSAEVHTLQQAVHEAHDEVTRLSAQVVSLQSGVTVNTPAQACTPAASAARSNPLYESGIGFGSVGAAGISSAQPSPYAPQQAAMPGSSPAIGLVSAFAPSPAPGSHEHSAQRAGAADTAIFSAFGAFRNSPAPQLPDSSVWSTALGIDGEPAVVSPASAFFPLPIAHADSVSGPEFTPDDQAEPLGPCMHLPTIPELSLPADKLDPPQHRSTINMGGTSPGSQGQELPYSTGTPVSLAGKRRSQSTSKLNARASPGAFYYGYGSEHAAADAAAVALRSLAAVARASMQGTPDAATANGNAHDSTTSNGSAGKGFTPSSYSSTTSVSGARRGATPGSAARYAPAVSASCSALHLQAPSPAPIRRTITPGRRMWDIPTEYCSPLTLALDGMPAIDEGIKHETPSVF